MRETNLRVLLIEDNLPDADLLAEALSGQEACFEVIHVECMAEAEERLRQQPPIDVILLDLGLPDSDGLDSLERATRAAPLSPVIVLTGLEDEVVGMEAVGKGAQDYLVKGQTPPRSLVRSLYHAIERTRLADSLIEAKTAAEAANAAKGRFLANVSHELRTPMNAILGMIDLAMARQVDPTALEFLKTARGSADLLLTLLNDLLDSAKIEAGKLELELAPLSLRRVMEQTAQVLALRAGEKGVSFLCRIPDETPDALIGDQVRLRQILLNLAGNAIKFTAKGEVTVGVCVESQEAEAIHLKFSVRDTGIGIAHSDLEKIFQPFVQADLSTTRRFGGSGLGLAISSNLVGMMGGRIWAESEIGKGSAFHFVVRMPLAGEIPAIAAPCAVPLAAAATQLRLLLAEDNPANQKLVAYILQDRGHVVEIAGDGHEAVRLSRRNRYDAILMDVQMPEMNGLEAAMAIRKREDGGSRVPIIAMTAHTMKDDRDRCLAAGMDGYLSKPIGAAEMIAMVEQLAVGAAAPIKAFDLEEALQRCFDPKMFQGMVDYFFAEAAGSLERMRAAIAQDDGKSLSATAHHLRGTLGYLGAAPACDAAQRLEQAGKAGDLSSAAEALAELAAQIEFLSRALAAYRQGG